MKSLFDHFKFDENSVRLVEQTSGRPEFSSPLLPLRDSSRSTEEMESSESGEVKEDDFSGENSC